MGRRCQGCEEGWFSYRHDFGDGHGSWTMHEKPSGDDWISTESVRCDAHNSWVERHPVYTAVIVALALIYCLGLIQR